MFLINILLFSLRKETTYFGYLKLKFQHLNIYIKKLIVKTKNLISLYQLSYY